MLRIWIIFQKLFLTLQTLQDIAIEIQVKDPIILALTSSMEAVNYSKRLMNVIS
jgi:hypothetical protein